jgi:hypothetical protein
MIFTGLRTTASGRRAQVGLFLLAPVAAQFLAIACDKPLPGRPNRERQIVWFGQPSHQAPW